ncbi:hypothetical protein C8R46DRAFT_1301911, partial [Mycena filopes]
MVCWRPGFSSLQLPLSTALALSSVWPRQRLELLAHLTLRYRLSAAWIRDSTTHPYPWCHSDAEMRLRDPGRYGSRRREVLACLSSLCRRISMSSHPFHSDHLD